MPRFIVKKGSGRVQLLELSPGSHELGRADEMDVVLQNVSVSRHHGRLVVSRG